MFQGLNDKINKLWSQTGLSLDVQDQAPDTIEAVIQSFNGTSIKVFSGSSDQTIYGDALVNFKFRALHDLEHIKLQADFTLSGETQAATKQVAQFEGFEAVILAEVIGQAECFFKTGMFPADQVKFIKDNMDKYLIK